MFEIRVEWLEAPGVVDPVLARTWARLELVTSTGSPTRFLCNRSGSVRSGVFGSAFPMAAWIVDNWWALSFEGARSPNVSARRQGRNREWMSRHNLHTCREGMAYPDLAIHAEDELIVVRWFADPEETTLSGRFVGGGIDWTDPDEMRRVLGDFVDSVRGRLDGLDDERVQTLDENWLGILDSTKHEHDICAKLGMLGLDPYDVDEGIENALRHLDLPEAVIHDLLGTSSRDAFANDLGVTREFINKLPPPRPPHPLPIIPVRVGRDRPYQVGYARADAVRSHLRLAPDEPIEDLRPVLRQLVGDIQLFEVSTSVARVEAAVQLDRHPSICFSGRAERQERFLHARALHHWLFVADEGRPTRLLTRGYGGTQAASRAFAAELLAPASALNAALSEGVYDVEEELAQRFNVSPEVILRQLQNHDLL